jgi:hypothetical protein
MQEQTFNNHLDTDPSSATNYVEGVEAPHPEQEPNLDLINALLDIPPPKNGAEYNGSEQALENIEDNDNPESIMEIAKEFPDFRDYVYHAFFPSFLNVWCEFRRAKIWAKHPEKIPEVRVFLGELRASIITLCLQMVLSHTNNENGTSRHESFLMFSAVKKLDREIEKAQYVFSIIENSLQGPAEAIAPLMQFSDELGAKVNQILDPNYKFDAADDFALFYDSKIRNLGTDELQAMARDTFNRTPFQVLDLNSMQTNPSNVKGLKLLEQFKL